MICGRGDAKITSCENQTGSDEVGCLICKRDGLLR